MQKSQQLILILLLFGNSLLTFSKESFIPKTFEANFVKKEKAILSGKTIKSEGELYYQYPSRIRLEFQGNDKSVFVSNPFKTFYYKPPIFEGVPGELTVNKSNNYPLSKFFDSLRSGLKSNELYSVKKSQNKLNIKFTKKGILELKILSAELTFKKSLIFLELEKLQIELDNNKKLNFELNKIKVNPKLDKNLFTFEAPKNTRTSY